MLQILYSTLLSILLGTFTFIKSLREASSLSFGLHPKTKQGTTLKISDDTVEVLVHKDMKVLLKFLIKIAGRISRITITLSFIKSSLKLPQPTTERKVSYCED